MKNVKVVVLDIGLDNDPILFDYTRKPGRYTVVEVTHQR